MSNGKRINVNVFDQSKSRLKIDSLLSLVEKLLEKLTGLETKLNEKCDMQEVNKMENRLKEVEDFSVQQGRDFEKRISAIEGKTVQLA